MAGLYVHIPFCKSRCIYCAFYSTTLSSLHEEYVNALCREMDTRPLPGDGCRSVYIGGGTPSQLPVNLLRRLLLYINKVYRVDDGAEVTIECNPDDITPAYAQAIKELPVNRVSLGAQTFSDERLRWLRRRHNASQVASAVTLLREAGIRNISIDLMFGFPGVAVGAERRFRPQHVGAERRFRPQHQSLAEWEYDIRQALALQPEHISAYSLMIEEGTPLFEMTKASLLSPQAVDDELSRQMYETLIDRLTAAGYEHYEISNFARPGFRSRHNSSYWNDTPYLGIGAAAHSYDRQCRWWNVADVKAYIEKIGKGLSVVEDQEAIDLLTHYNDCITTALRTREGIALQPFRDTFPESYYDYLLANAAPHLQRGTLTIDNGSLHLTRKGLFVSDDIMSDLIQLSS